RTATGWPVTKWLSGLRPDPLRRLHLDGVQRTGRTSLPEPTPVQRARVDGAVRSVADAVTAGMARPWASAIRDASLSRLDGFSQALDAAVASTELGARREPLWWRGVRALQWLLFLVAVAGGLWLLTLAVFAFLRLPEPDSVDWHGLPVPTLMLLGGVAVGVLVAVGCRYAARVSARRRAARARTRLRSAIASVTDELVVDPMGREIDAYNRCRDGVRMALRA
ncbi:MAG TPA: ABC transporter, partial [Nocardioidaceae bacterium]